MVKNLTANAGDVRGAGLIRDWEDPLEESMATHSSILTWRMSWTEEAGKLQSKRSPRIARLKKLSTAHIHTHTHVHAHTHTHAT